MIPVTKCFLPPQQEYQKILEEAWDNKWITNRGVLVKRLEKEIEKFLSVESVIATTNGTLPLQIAIKSLNLGGEIITTPFSYVATTSSIIWESCDPVFVDISPDFLTIDEGKIEAAITTNTSAILATHVFGNPCNVSAIERIAKKYNVKVIYDAAHCFGVKYLNRSIFDFGDVSTCSFHATKIFHTGEGGAIFCKDEALRNRLFYSHNFGHKGHEDFHGLGINAKMSELQAALGLAIFPYFQEIVKRRKELTELYDENLRNLSKVRTISFRDGLERNYSYYPVIFESEALLKKVQEKLVAHDIHPRRYFYPSLNTLPYVVSVSMPVSESIANRILCLPLYFELEDAELMRITELVIDTV